MTRRARRAADPIEAEIEAALDPGQFVPDRACFSFVSSIEEVENEIAQIMGEQPARAVTLYETFLAGCYEKTDELDDSSGSFGMFVATLFCGWIKARQAAGTDPHETALRLLTWMDDDPFGFCHRLEKDAVGVLDKAGLAALAAQVRGRYDASLTTPPAADDSPRSNGYARRRWGEVLRTLYAAQKDLAAYVGLAEETGLSAQDCHVIGTMLGARRRLDEALSWVERGVELDKKAPHGSWASHDLATLKRRLLTKLGRDDEALASAWADYREHPSKYSYRDLMRFVPKTDRPAWHEKAIDAATGTDLHSLVELLLDTKEIERLAELVRRSTNDALESVSHYAAEPAARKLEKTHADAAARLWRALGMRIVNAKKSRNYEVALGNFERAKRCYEKTGLAAEWEDVVNEVHAEHRRKTAFMPGFEAIVTGSGRRQEPPFLERAKTRWNVRESLDA